MITWSLTEFPLLIGQRGTAVAVVEPRYAIANFDLMYMQSKKTLTILNCPNILQHYSVNDIHNQNGYIKGHDIDTTRRMKEQQAREQDSTQ